METLFTLHAHMRHLLLLLAGLAVIAPLISVFRKSELSKPAVLLVRVYTVVLTAQFLIGLVQIIVRWSDYGDVLRYRLEHAVLMTVAVALAHIGMKATQKPLPIGPRNTTILMLGSFIIMMLGILMIGQR